MRPTPFAPVRAATSETAATPVATCPAPHAAEPTGVTVKSCADDNNIGDRMLHKHIAVGMTYQDTSQSVIAERLARAGIRLAMILNDAAKTNP